MVPETFVITWEAEGAEEAAPIYFTCHMDTVTPGQGIKPELGEDGWIRSDGTTILGADDKGVLPHCLKRFVPSRRMIPARLILTIFITVGEESGLVGARAMNPKDIEAEFGYALDPTVL